MCNGLVTVARRWLVVCSQRSRYRAKVQLSELMIGSLQTAAIVAGSTQRVPLIEDSPSLDGTVEGPESKPLLYSLSFFDDSGFHI